LGLAFEYFQEFKGGSFRVNKPLLISKQTMDVMWQNILPRHLIISTWQTYIKNIPRHGMEYALRFLPLT
jgi:hypothetical protein